MKQQPQRMCSGCRARKEKGELVRVVRSPEGEISLDATGKKNGRGAYLCPDANCLKLARKARRLERTFKGAVPDDVYQALEEALGRVEQ